ncbi:hypothetical protein OIU79_019229 [Salix purpurea]|uniref:Major facilitator superfamily (MFS) profile domain-containing protein n=1 Tax=Salix purpurea TaxID=77065 RepID=A0A9Q0P0Q1_SALPP|nr:hypothetical protein OIU79_019229 [Salix purpurea]
MWVATVLPKPAPPVLSVLTSSRNPKQNSIHFRFSYRPLNFKLSATKQQQQLPEPKAEKKKPSSSDIGWLPAFPHVLIASMSNFVFGYHIGVMNGPIVSVAKDLGFEGNSILEGLVVSIFIVGAFLGSVASGSVVDKLGCRRTFQLDTIPLILGALISAQAHSLDEILWGRFLVGLGIGVNTVLVPIYISEVAPTKYRGSLGTLCQIGTCLGIIASLFLDIPSETDPHWWRTILYIASAPGFFSCTWYAVGRLDDAKTVIRNLWDHLKLKAAIQDFQSVIENNGVNVGSGWLELLEEPHSRAAFIGDVGITSGSLASLFVGLANFAGALSALYLMDKEGETKAPDWQLLGNGSFNVSYCLCYQFSNIPSESVVLQNTTLSSGFAAFSSGWIFAIVHFHIFPLELAPVTGLIILRTEQCQDAWERLWGSVFLFIGFAISWWVYYFFS